MRREDNNPEIIEFNVELAPIPNFEGKPNDVTMNWKLLSGFNANKTFWTDENGLQMAKKHIEFVKNNRTTIANNFFPITSAIAARDQRENSNIQVTIMNDRT